MHEYELVEKRWRRYRYKRVLMKVVFIGIVAILLFILYSLLPQIPLPSLPFLTSKLSQQNYLAPSLDFEKHLKKYVIHTPPQTKTSYAKKSEKEIPKESAPKNRKFLISAQKLTLTQMLDKYKKAPSIDLAIMIANEYFQQKKYKQAMEWAIKANSFDTENEKSWIIYAKSAYKLGDKNKAVNALKIYLYKHKSPQVKKLLTQILQQEGVQ